MKFLLTLAVLAASIQLAQAQSTTPTTIDPAARDLLARLNARYKSFDTFQSIIEVRTSEPVPWTYNRIRVQLTRFSGVVSTAIPNQGTEKRVFDGQTELRLNSRFPDVFKIRLLNAERYSMSVFLKQAGAKGTTIDLLYNDSLASFLLDPDLKSVVLGPTETLDGQPMRTILFQFAADDHSATLKLFIDAKNLLLRRADGQETVSARSKFFSLSETYSQIKFNDPLPELLFSTKAPSGLKQVSDFPNEVVKASRPVPEIILPTK